MDLDFDPSSLAYEPEPNVLGYIAIDQYGHSVKLTDSASHPKGQLLKKLGVSRAENMFVDSISGESKHIGYIVGDNWYTIYKISEWVGKAK